MEDDAIVLGTEGAALTGGATDSEAYRDLLAAAGAPDKATAAFYLDTPRVMGLVPSNLDPNLEALGGVVYWQAAEGDTCAPPCSSRSRASEPG